MNESWLLCDNYHTIWLIQQNLHLQTGASPVQLESISHVLNDWPITVCPAEQRYWTVEPTLNESDDARSLFE